LCYLIHFDRGKKREMSVGGAHFVELGRLILQRLLDVE